MAKVAKPRKVPSVRSRVSRRAASPVAKSLQTDKTTTHEEEYTSAVLNSRQGGSIIKKKQKPLSKKQRLRREKGIERAYAVTDQLEKRVVKNKNKNKVIKDRSADWEDINDAPSAKARSKPSKKISVKSGTDDVMEDVVNTTDKQLATAGANSTEAHTATDDLELIT